MKKTYIEPKTTVVALNVRNNLLVESNVTVSETPYDPSTSGEIQSREIIQSRDVWEEW